MGKIKKIFQRIASAFSKKAAENYYSQKWLSIVYQSHPSVVVKGNFWVSDPGNVVVGKNVLIGKNCRFYSEGGIYLEDGCIIEDNALIRTYTKSVSPSKFDVYTIPKLFPAFSHGVAFGSRSSYPCFFIVSTGRSGTNALSHLLNKHPQLSCLHEPRFVLNRLSAELAHHLKSKEDVKKELISLYTKISLNTEVKPFFGECDQKSVNLIPLLQEIFPQAKFIWLIRRAEDFVSSAYGRRWFDEYEYTYPKPVFSHDVSNDITLFDKYRLPYSRYRLNGYLAGIFSKEEWLKMGCFERCCWYWNYWNTVIENHFREIPRSMKLFVRLEELESAQTEIFSFLGVDINQINTEQTNKAYYPVLKQEKWTFEQRNVFNNWCAEGMNKWYGKQD